MAATIVRGIVAVTAPLIDDEAYYWLWARHLDWSYLDHPPMVAYMIYLTTLPGVSALWIRLGPLVLGAATTYALFLFGRDLFDARTGFLAALIYQLVPVLVGSALLATPDAPLFLAWTLVMRFVWQALHGLPQRWTAAGFVLGLGALSKLYVVFLALGVAIFVLFYARHWLARPHAYLAIGLAVVLFLPVIYWNVTHEWAMVRFILYQRPPGTPRGVAGVEELLVQQFAFALLLFPLFVYALYLAWQRRRNERYAYLLWTALPVLAATMAIAAATGAPHGNWMGPGYLSLAVILGTRWNRFTTLLASGSALILLYSFALPLIPALPPPPGAQDVYGWEEAAARAQHEWAALGQRRGLVADRYQVAAQLAYYTRDTIPVTLLPCPIPGSIWPTGGAFAATEAVAVLDARWTPMVNWDQFARRVEEAAPLAVEFHGRPLRMFRVFRLYQLISAPCSAL